MKINYKEINEQMLTAMQTHGADWINPMRSSVPVGIPRNGITGNRYNGVNIWLLGLTESYWATYAQWESKGYQVAPGSKSTTIVFFKQTKVKDRDSGEDKTIPVMKNFRVFRSDQLDPSVKVFEEPERIIYADETHANAAVEAWVANTGIEVTTNPDGRAFYSPMHDLISIPPREGFTATETSTASETRDSTLLHELAHATGHKSRLDRKMGSGFGSDGYAREELVAELAAAYQSALLGVSAAPRADHAKYLNNWIKCLKDDHRAFFRASALAQKAVEWIEKQQPVSAEVAA